jgi:hypothetical protein
VRIKIPIVQVPQAKPLAILTLQIFTIQIVLVDDFYIKIALPKLSVLVGNNWFPKYTV